MTIGDRWGADESPSGYELQYAAQVEGDSPGIASYIRQTGDVLGGLMQLQQQYRAAQIDDAQLRAQIERARAGQPPIMTAAGPGMGGMFAGVPGWKLAALGALIIGGVLLGKRGR